MTNLTKLLDQDLIEGLQEIPIGERWVWDEELNELIRRYNNKKKECEELKKAAEASSNAYKTLHSRVF